MKILYLTLKKKWFDLIVSGKKLEEYREIKSHWVYRLLSPTKDFFPDSFDMDEFIYDLNHPFERFSAPDEVLNYFNHEIRKFTHVKFSAGYGRNSPSITMPIEDIHIGAGRPEWGAEKGRYYFVISVSVKSE
jgi:hypothetical protein